jgi:tRNA U38,U39,U40 pseudouridine synthase TruA
LLSTSRTDTGVHARELLVHTSIPTAELKSRTPEELLHAWNSRLPEDLRVRRVRYAHPSQIQVKHASLGKQYSFYVRTGCYHAGLSLGDYTMYVANLHTPAALERLAGALKLFEGRHDFGAFCMGRSSSIKSGKNGTSTVRLITRAEVSLLSPLEVNWGLEHPAPTEQSGRRIAPCPTADGRADEASAQVGRAGSSGASSSPSLTAAATLAGVKRPSTCLEEGRADAAQAEGAHLVRMLFIGDGFLRHQIRLIVGAALSVVRGTSSLEDITKALESGQWPSVGAAQAGGGGGGGGGGGAGVAVAASGPRFVAAAGRGLWLERVVTHAELWTAKDFCNNRDPDFIKEHGLSADFWHPARFKRGGEAVPGWVAKGSPSAEVDAVVEEKGEEEDIE